MRLVGVQRDAQSTTNALGRLTRHRSLHDLALAGGEIPSRGETVTERRRRCPEYLAEKVGEAVGRKRLREEVRLQARRGVHPLGAERPGDDERRNLGVELARLAEELQAITVAELDVEDEAQPSRGWMRERPTSGSGVVHTPRGPMV